METLLIIFVFGLIFAGFSIPLSRAKGKDVGTWFALCFIFGIFAFLALMGMPADMVQLTRNRINAGNMKVCEACAEAIRTPATICGYCGTPQPES